MLTGDLSCLKDGVDYEHLLLHARVHLDQQDVQRVEAFKRAGHDTASIVRHAFYAVLCENEAEVKVQSCWSCNIANLYSRRTSVGQQASPPTVPITSLFFGTATYD